MIDWLSELYEELRAGVHEQVENEDSEEETAKKNQVCNANGRIDYMPLMYWLTQL